MVDVEHDVRELNVNVLVIAPEILSSNNFCLVEYLIPLKFNLSGTCYTSPVRQTNLALITCPNSKSIVPLEAEEVVVSKIQVIEVPQRKCVSRVPIPFAREPHDTG